MVPNIVPESLLWHIPKAQVFIYRDNIIGFIFMLFQDEKS